MPDNPYHNIFGDEFSDDKQNRAAIPIKEDGFAVGNQMEPLEAIQELIASFKSKSDQFSAFLSTTRAIDHLEEAHSAPSWLSLFIETGSNRSRGSLEAEKTHYTLLQTKFHGIITQMKELAFVHLEVIKRFNTDIDKHYFSLEKTQELVNLEIKSVIEQINLQRRILGNATRDLNILEGAMEAAEARLKRLIDYGGPNNLSSAEFEVLKLVRTEMTTGFSSKFNYQFFDINLIDKIALQFDIYLKKTTGQYLQELLRAMDQKT